MSTTPNLQRFVELGFIESNGVNLASTWRQHDSPKAEAKAETEAEAEEDIVVQDDTEKIPFREIVSHLNGKTGMSFKPTTTKTKSLIRARWIEGFRFADFQAVIDRMVDEWGADSKMMIYLRPVTLFGPKFEGYLNRPEKKDYGDKEPF